MPRNASGTYSLPAGNPVVSGTLIDSGWANTTMNDLGNEMTDSLSRSGEGGMLAPFRITDGLQATPSLAFSNEPSTGFYRAGTNEMWSVVGGTQITQFTATGMTGRFAAGAVSTPSFTAYNDLNTGIYFPAADEIAITTAGVQRLSINSTGTVSVPGNVAITGTFSVTGALTANNFSSSGATLTGGSINNMAIGGSTAAAGSFTTLTSSSTVTMNGGTANGVLYLNGSKVATSGSALTFDGTTLGSTGGVKVTGSAASLAIDGGTLDYSSNVTRLAAGRADGNFGEFQLYVAGASGITKRFAAHYDTTFLWFGSDGTSEQMRLTNTGLEVKQKLAVGYSDFSGIPAYGAAFSGSVGIGTSSPEHKLQVSGSAYIINAYNPSTANDQTARISVRTGLSGATDAGFELDIVNDNTNSAGQRAAIQAYRYNSGWIPLDLSISSGNVGIGTTSPTAKLHVSGGNIRLNDNQVLEWGGGANYIYGSNSANILVLATNNTERARITSGGELLVGTTTANSATGITLRADGVIVAKGVYNTLVSSNTRDIYMDDTGYFGYISSTRNSKTNIQDATDVSWLLALNPVSFNYKKFDREINAHVDEPANEVQYGLIAEDVEAVKPELCFYDEVDGEQELRGVSYSKLITPMLKLIQQQQAAIAALEAKVAALETK